MGNSFIANCECQGWFSSEASATCMTLSNYHYEIEADESILHVPCEFSSQLLVSIVTPLCLSFNLLGDYLLLH